MASVQLVGAGTVFILHILVARLFGTEPYGLFAHAVAISGLLGMMAPLGWNNAIVRFTAQYRSEEAWGLLKGAWLSGNRLTLAVSLGVSGVLLMIALFMDIDPSLKVSLLTSAALVPILGAMEIRRRGLQGHGVFSRSVIPEQVLLPLLGIVAAIFIWRFGSFRDFLYAYVIIAVVAVMYAELQIRKAMKGENGTARPSFQLRAWMFTAIPMLGSSIGYLVLNRLDVTLLGMLVEMSDVGEYAAAKRIVVLGAFVLAALNSVAAPSFAAAAHQGHRHELRDIVSRVRLISCCIGLPVFVVLLLFPDLFLSAFKIDSTSARDVLRILAVGQIINVATGPVGTAMAMSGQERMQALICGVIAAFAVLTMPFAVTRWGLVGAAFVTSASVAFQNLWMLLALTKFVHRIDGSSTT